MSQAAENKQTSANVHNTKSSRGIQ